MYSDACFGEAESTGSDGCEGEKRIADWSISLPAEASHPGDCATVAIPSTRHLNQDSPGLSTVEISIKQEAGKQGNMLRQKLGDACCIARQRQIEHYCIYFERKRNL